VPDFRQCLAIENAGLWPSPGATAKQVQRAVKEKARPCFCCLQRIVFACRLRGFVTLPLYRVGDGRFSRNAFIRHRVEQYVCCLDRRLAIRSHTGHRTGALRLLEGTGPADEIGLRSVSARSIAILFVLSLLPLTLQRGGVCFSRQG